MLHRLLRATTLAMILARLASAQAALASAPQTSTVRVKSPHLAAYAKGADAEVRAFLFRGIAPGLMRGHPRYVHALAITNAPAATCATALLHGEAKKGTVIDFVPSGESEFIAVFSSGFSEEPEFSYMGLDFIMLDSLGSYRDARYVEYRQGSEAESAIRSFMKLDRKERFELMRGAMPQLWPFRPRTMTAETRTITRGDRTGTGHVWAVKPPNLVTIEAQLDKLELAGVVAVTTCK